MTYTPADKFPASLNVFQLQTPTYPNPRLDGPIDANATTIIVTSPPKDENGSIITGNFHAGIGSYDGFVETVYIPVGGVSADGLTWSNVVRGIRLTGLDYTTSDASLAVAHDADSPVVCNISAILFNLMRAALNGTIASGGLTFKVGDGTDSNISVVAYNADTNKPAWRYNASTNQWEYSNDGVTFQPFGTGSGLTASNGVLISSGDIQLDQTTNAAATAMVAANSGALNKFTTSGTANTTFSSGDALSFDGASRLVKADGNDLVPFGMYAGIATAGGTAGGATTFCVNGVVTVPAFSLAERVNCASSLGEYNTTTNTTTDAISSTNVWRAQTFIPQAGQDNVYQVTIAITDSSLVGTMVAQIYATSGTAPNAIPTGAALGTSANVTVFGSSVTFTFTTPIAVTPLTAYAIVVKLTARTSGSFAWNYNNTSVYASGNSATSPDSGVSWTPETTYDRYFQVTFKGLAGSPVFLSDTAGALSLTPGTYPAKIGRAIDSTHVLLDTPLKTVSGTVSGTMPSCSVSTSGTVSASVTSTISVGGRPLYVWYHMYGGSSATNPMKLGVWGVNGRECCHYESTTNSYIATSGNTCPGNDSFSNTYNSSVYFSSFGPDSITFARAVSTTKGGSTTSPAVTGGSFTLIFVAIIL